MEKRKKREAKLPFKGWSNEYNSTGAKEIQTSLGSADNQHSQSKYIPTRLGTHTYIVHMAGATAYASL